MQRYKYLHEINDLEFSMLVAIIEDHESMKWLSPGHGNSEWNHARLNELREYSRADSRPGFRAQTRKYYYWAILIENVIVGMIGIHPAPMNATEAILRENAGFGIPIRLQFMIVIAPGYRRRGVASRAIDDMTRAHPNVCIVIRADNEVAIHMMTNIHKFVRVLRVVLISDEPAIVYKPRHMVHNTLSQSTSLIGEKNE